MAWGCAWGYLLFGYFLNWLDPRRRSIIMNHRFMNPLHCIVNLLYVASGLVVLFGPIKMAVWQYSVLPTRFLSTPLDLAHQEDHADWCASSAETFLETVPIRLKHVQMVQTWVAA